MANATNGANKGPESITTLHAGEGAEVTTRKNASHAADLARANAEERFRRRHASDKLSAAAGRASGRPASKKPVVASGPQRTNKNIFIAVGSAVVALILVFFLVRCATSVVTPRTEAPAPSAEEQPSEAQQQESAADGAVTLHGVSYALAQVDGGWAVTADGATAFELSGTPSGIIVSNGILIIPESLESGWDVLAYMPADGSLPTQVTNSDGSPVTGSGSITSAELDGANLLVTDSAGATTAVALE